jgi:uncharacterized membrane protein
MELAIPPDDYMPIVNARLVASAFAIAMMYGLARLHRLLGEQHGLDSVARAALLIAANGLTLTLITSEMSAYWYVRDAKRAIVDSMAVNSEFSRQAMTSVIWAVYATILIVVGLWRRYAPIRYFAIGVFGLSIVKVFVVDLAELDRVYRIASIIGLGVTLLTTSYLYQRFLARTAPLDEVHE